MDITNIPFQSQHKPQTKLSDYLCGIACLSMVLKYFNQIPHDENLLTVFEKYLSVGKNNVPYTSIKVNVKNKNLQVPIIYYPKASSINIEDKVKIKKDSSRLLKLLNFKHKLADIKLHFPNPSDKYIPSFSLWYGFDHRGITPFIAKNKYQIKHELKESKFPIILKALKDRPQSIAILSINPTYIGQPINVAKTTYKDSKEKLDHQDRHDIVLIKIMRYQQQDVALITDPAHRFAHSGIQVISLKTIELAYTGHASIFSS